MAAYSDRCEARERVWDIRHAHMPYLYAMAHRGDGQGPEFDDFCPTSNQVPTDEDVGFDQLLTLAKSGAFGPVKLNGN